MSIILRVIDACAFLMKCIRVAIALLIMVGCAVELFRDPWNPELANRMLVWVISGWLLYALAYCSLRFIAEVRSLVIQMDELFGGNDE